METLDKDKELYQEVDSEVFYILKMIIYSTIGIIIFFIPININGENMTILYHMSHKLQNSYRIFLQACIVVFVTINYIREVILNKDKVFGIKKILMHSKLISIILIINVFYGKNKGVLTNIDTVFLIEETVLNLATMLPLSAIFITFILDYGLVEIIESYFQKIMKKTFNLSGKTILNIVFYIFTDSFCGYFMTEKLYTDGKIRQNEACILILNFSILSYPMITYMSEELNLKKFNLIIISILVLIMTNIILSKLYPITKKKKSYYIKTTYKESIHKKNKFKKAIKKHLNNRTDKNIFESIINNLEESIYIIMKLIPSVVIVLYIGYFVINYEIITDIINSMMYPIVTILKIPDYKQLSRFIINLFYNNIIAIDLIYINIDYVTKFLIGIVVVLNCTSISTNMIYISNSKIPISKSEALLSYVFRNLIIIFIYFTGYYLYMGYIK
ncbi:MAG: nucleoside recognition domain-containing protein [Peptostreptococcaceae bacterium]